MGEGWFGWAFSGAAFGAALGVLRNQLKILGTLQAVAMTVLSILAVPLALGLVLFLVAMAISGPEVLWQATRSATPILLLCAAGAWVLANAILRDSDHEMSGNRVLRWSADPLSVRVRLHKQAKVEDYLTLAGGGHLNRVRNTIPADLGRSHYGVAQGRGDDGRPAYGMKLGALEAVARRRAKEVGAAVGLAGKSVRGMSFSLFDGRATFDRTVGNRVAKNPNQARLGNSDG